MQDLENIKKDISFTTVVKDLVKIYEEIALMKMKKIRSSVIKTRRFAQTIYPIFYEVKDYCISEIEDDQEAASFSTIEKNGKSLNILLTPNDKLVGDISEKVVKSYIAKGLNPDSGLVVIGRAGRKIIDAKFPGLSYFYFDLPEKGSTFLLDDIIKLIISYQNINIFYPKFISFINQASVKENLSGEILPDQDILMRENVENNYIFEPSAEDVLNFFEVEIFSSVFKQKIAESELAKLGSRVIAMESAARNAEQSEKKLKASQFILEKAFNNRKQLERLSGLSLWGDKV